MIKIKRAYEEHEKEDGTRILVDRLWPRGVTKRSAKINEWMKDIAPSDELRRWFQHDPNKWEEFKRRYRRELEHKKELIERLHAISRNETLTLVYSAKDSAHNQAIVLKEVLEQA
jgi:uncharacterized protein YeaO (DUF488 family)